VFSIVCPEKKNNLDRYNEYMKVKKQIEAENKK